MGSPMVQVTGLTKEYPATNETTGLKLFDRLTFHVERGEMLAIVGTSGAGKSTLLHLLAGLDHATAGEVVVDGITIATLNPNELATFRNRTIGYVWQAHYLLPEFTAAENVAMPLLARGVPQAEGRECAAFWLDQVGLRHRLSNRAGELSGGEQQRVSLARALVTAPKVLLADEPTGNLDTATGEIIFQLLRELHHQHGTTTILVTHNSTFAERCGRTLRLCDGLLV